MNYLNEYMSRHMSHFDLENELTKLIREYNELRNCTMLVYAATTESPIPDVALNQKDFYFIKDLLDSCDTKSDKLEIYLETPGGRGETAEEIVKYVRKKYKNVSFVICGEAKSAGTILTMSGDEILMTDTGSLGPIDAQMVIGRSQVSAYDYTSWVDEKRLEATKGPLNQVDIAILAQISPGEIKGAINAQEYAVDMVEEWLVKYKFKNWNETETHHEKVTEDKKKKRAREIANDLNNHNKWKTHGRSLKREDLERLKLKIINVEEDEKLKKIVYRIHTICRLIYMTGNTYKVIATSNNKISFTANPLPPVNNQPKPEIVELDVDCPKCGKKHNLYLKLINNDNLDIQTQQKGRIKFPKDNILKCDCGYEMNLVDIRNNVESQIGVKTIE